MTTLPLLGAALLWNIGLGATHLLTPLLAASLGMSASQIGLLLSIPVALQMLIILAGGAFVDGVGAKTVVLVGCGMLAAAAVLFVGASGFIVLLVAQLLAVLSRATFWPALWSLASALPGKSAKHLGLLNSAVNAGQAIGASGAGALLVEAGYGWSYSTVAALALLSFASLRSFRDTPLPRSPEKQTLGTVLRTYGHLSKRPSLHYSAVCSYVSAMPLALTFSFYPILLLSQGFQADEAGYIVSFRALGGIALGLVVGRWLLDPFSRWPALVGTFAIIIPLALTTISSDPVVNSLLMFLVGAGSAAMMVLFQLALSSASGASRGSAMALGTIGGTVANLTTPLLVGFVIDWFDIRTAFIVMAVVGLACALALAPLRISALRELGRS